MPVRRMTLVHIDPNIIRRWFNETDPLSIAIKAQYLKVVKYIYDYKNNKIETTLAYLVDIELILDTYNVMHPIENLTNEEIVYKIDEFFNYLEYNFLLSMGKLDLPKLITLYYIKNRGGITRQAMNHLIETITKKYLRYPEEGLPAGMEAATSISEVETQSSLSSHLQFTKNGGNVKNTQQSSNTNLMKINVNKVGSNSNIVHMKSYYRRDLEMIRAGLEYVSLEDLALSITYTKHSTIARNHRVSIILSKNSMTNFIVSRDLFERILFEFFDKTTYIVSADIRTDFDHDQTLGYSCYIELTDNIFLPVLKLTFNRGVNKGIFSLYRFSLEKVTRLSLETLDPIEEWVLIGELSSLSYLKDYDTSRVKVIPSIEILHNYIGSLQAYNMLILSYTTNGLMRFQTLMISLNQFRSGIIQRVHKNHGDEMSTISKVAFITPTKDMQEAALRNKTEPVEDISSCILLSIPIKVGTGHSETYISLDQYLNQSPPMPIQEIYD